MLKFLLKLAEGFSKDQIPGTSKNIWYEAKAEGVTVKSFIKTSERSKVVPQNSVQSHKKPFKEIKGVLHKSCKSNTRVSMKYKGLPFNLLNRSQR